MLFRSLTRTLGIRSVAEGVESPEHLRMVREAGCDLAQGWLLGRPMPAADVPAWVDRLHSGDLRHLCAPPTARGAGHATDRGRTRPYEH